MDRYGPQQWHIVKDSRRLPCPEHRGDPDWKCFIPGTPFYGERVRAIVHDPDMELAQSDRWRDWWQAYWAQIQCRIAPTRTLLG